MRNLGVNSDEFVCGVCLCLCRDAVQTPCGHLFCSACIKTSLRRTRRCPECRQEMSSSDVTKSRWHRRYVRLFLAADEADAAFESGAESFPALSAVSARHAEEIATLREQLGAGRGRERGAFCCCR